MQTKQAERRFGHYGELRCVEESDGTSLYDPISNVQMVGPNTKDVMRAWIRILKACATPRRSLKGTLRAAILERDGFRCVLCGTHRDQGVALHIDHILPVWLSGDDHPDNLRVLCDPCNQARNADPAFGFRPA